MQSNVLRQKVDTDNAGRRLDNYLFSILKKVPKSHVYRIIRTGEVRIDGSRVKPSCRLRAGTEIRIPPTTIQRPPATPVVIKPHEEQYVRESILYHDDALLVLNKPAGYSVHAGSRRNIGLTEMLRVLLPVKVTPAHRLDHGTSGCLLFAKTSTALRALHGSFRQRTVKKNYLALLTGRWDARLTSVNVPLIARHRRQNADVQVDQNRGYATETRFEIVHRFAQATLVRVQPFSGRMHQIRVHAAHCEHPVAGDRRYGNFAANRQLKKLGLNRLFLHAEYIKFDYNDRHYAFHAPLPDELSRFLHVLEPC